MIVHKKQITYEEFMGCLNTKIRNLVRETTLNDTIKRKLAESNGGLERILQPITPKAKDIIIDKWIGDLGALGKYVAIKGELQKEPFNYIYYFDTERNLHYQRICSN